MNLCQAVPSYAPAEILQAEIARLATEPGTHLYTDINGVPELREALARHMAADYQSAVAPENVMITSGCNQAFCAAIMALAQRGDNVVLPVPYYFNHQMWLDMLGVEKRLVPAFCGGPRLSPASGCSDAHRQPHKGNCAVLAEQSNGGHLSSRNY